MSDGASTRSVRGVPPSVNGWNAEFIDAEYQRFLSDPSSVADDLRAFFQGFDLAMERGQAPIARSSGEASPFQSAVDELIAAYRELGHLAASLDPFGRPRPRPDALSLSKHGLHESDLGRTVEAGLTGLTGSATLRQVIDHMEQTYCRSIGIEFMHIQNERERAWFLENFEQKKGMPALSPSQRKHVLEQLTRGETFEAFLGKRYGTEKRFSLEGGITLIPLIDQAIETASELGVEEIVLGMAHRGRLNVLINIIGKTYEQVFTEFEDNWEAGFADGGGDVKYHRGYSGTRTLTTGKSIHLAMASNPSHLESVNGVVMGRCRAKQRVRDDKERRRVIPMLIHGDAAVCAQGAVAECLNLSQLEGYTVGGTIHFVINNLIGFTTTPEDGRSTTYCTDVAKMIDAPILHVNGEDPEACVAAARLATQYRQQFRKDVFIDMYCYRKYGHNEGDEQSFTQPLLAALIKSKPSTLSVYAERLLREGVITADDAKAIGDRLDAALDSAQAAAKKAPFDPTIDPGSARWSGMTGTYSHAPVDTGVPMQTIKEVCAALGRVPDGFVVNPKLTGLLKSRAELPESGQISYADAELLAVGTLLLEGTPVRLSGQDSRRGTFTQRHAVVRDFQTGDPYIPLNNMREMGRPGTPDEPGTIGPDGRKRQARFCVYDSPLSEVSVLGFDYGYSLADPNMLVMWEAQFGDFANGAQVMIDQYIAPSEIKWSRWSGITLLLPHGYEGAGPEHSSARIERFLNLCGNDNIQVIYPTTAAQIFHALRRQVRRNFRKPLIVMTPKSMLRTPTSHIEDLTRGSFKEMIDDPAFEGKDAWDRSKVTKVIVCCGKVYFELAERRRLLNQRTTALLRIEQLYPFHESMMKSMLAKYSAGKSFIYAQEEPRNAGAYMYVADQFRTRFKIELEYIGREASATPAVGSKRADKLQQEAVISSAIGAKPKDATKDGKSEQKETKSSPVGAKT